jgi:hypothetical protein
MHQKSASEKLNLFNGPISMHISSFLHRRRCLLSAATGHAPSFSILGQVGADYGRSVSCG